MALSLLLVWCASTAVAMRYGDYSDVRMPHYGGLNDYDSPRDASQSDDYQGRSPDASASLDYKYDEDSRTRIDESTKEFNDSNWWRKRVRKQKKLGQATLEDKIKYDQENDEVPSFRLSSKQRTRHQDDFINGDETPSERLKKYSRNRKDVSDLDKKKYVGKDLSDNKRKKKYDDDMRQSKIRKTRDKHRTRKDIDSDLEKIRAQADIDDLDAYEDDDMQIERRLKGEFDKDVKSHSDKKLHNLKYTKSLHNNPDFDVADIKSEPLGHGDDSSGNDMLENDSFTVGRDSPRRKPSRHKRPLDSRRYRPTVQDDEDDVEPRVKKLKPSLPDDDYDNYFDMKSVQNIRSKLPSLLRRTTVQVTPTKTKWFQKLLTNRRKMADYDEEEDASVRAFVTSTSARSTTAIFTTTGTTSVTTSTLRTTTNVSTSKVESTAVWSPPQIQENRDTNNTQLSLAEKSRLSILKKAQRKEQEAPLSTKKPLVLLQVTKRLATVVMVEPPSSHPPWVRLHEFSEDKPERIEKVKRLMRHKLVAEAKNMRDLTDNWDSMVCDYIDVSLLDNSSTKLGLPCVFTLLFVVCAVYGFS